MQKQHPELDTLASAGGVLINMPFWQDLSPGDDEVLSDSLALEPGNIAALQDAAVLYMRGKAWAVNDLENSPGDDPMAQIRISSSDYWELRRQALLVSSLKGVFSAANMAVNLLDISGGMA